MDRFVARENIRHFRKLLERSTDSVEKERLLQLLVEEEKKLKVSEAKAVEAKHQDAGEKK